jgi:hypothetical protein
MKLVPDDCDRCRSARSVEHGVCQVCLAERTAPPVRLGAAIAKYVLRAQHATERVPAATAR